MDVIGEGTGTVRQAAQGVRGVLFDVDGTLYRQAPLRLLMAAELALDAMAGGSPSRTMRAARVLRTFRRTRERLRDRPDAHTRLEEAQYTVPARTLGLTADEVRGVVREWMLERPLKYMPRVRRPGLETLLDTLARNGVRVGALSDYPVSAKLEALGVDRYFSLALCTTDGAIDAFKPDPAGFRHACQVWGLAPQEVLYVGDRPDVDGAGAAAAGTRCVIVGGRRRGRRSDGRVAVVAAFHELERAFAG